MEDESQNEQDARVEKLWESLHTGSTKPLDLDGLRKGLRKIDHPLAHAENLLGDIFETVDTSGDGRIEYYEFRAFVEQTEKELWRLFKSIDRDHNGRLDRSELQLAFENAGIAIDSGNLDSFFDKIDTNHDGAISFDEWRNFLMFLPANSTNLKAVLSYYSSYVLVNQEGDVHVADEANSGIGTSPLLHTLFGVLFFIANQRARYLPTHLSETKDIVGDVNLHQGPSSDSDRKDIPWDPGEQPQDMAQITATIQSDSLEESFLHVLTTLLPDPGYFIAGGMAGAVSRTATAPLDRLKVYLIAQTGVKGNPVEAVKSGAPIQAAKSATGSLVNATLELWRMGGIRSLFAGNGLNVLKVMPESAIKFGSYEASKRVAAHLEGHNDPRSLSGLSQFFAAGMGGVISQLAVYPLDTLKFRMQCETVKGGLQGNELIVATAKKMIRESGPRAYYRGLGMGLIGMFPYSAIDLTTYEFLKRLITDRNATRRKCSQRDAEPGRIATGLIGAISSSFGASIVYPINLVRTRMQSQGTVIHPPTYNGWRDCFAKTVKGEGLLGLYKGLTPNLMKVVPSMSISYMVYEASKKVMDLR